MTESLEIIVKGLVEQADPIVQSVLNVYKTDEEHAVNKEALSKQTVEYLEKCATFFKIKFLNNANKKLYNKSQLSDRIILMIESYFPTTCQDCSDDYVISFNDPEPPVRCLFCLQGCHCCEQRLESIKELQKLPEKCLVGMAWLCNSCFGKKQCSCTHKAVHPQSSDFD